MNKFKTRMARQKIGGDNYISTRLSDCHNKLLNYRDKYNASQTIAERQFCATMLTMYRRRYDWYLKAKDTK